jgi:hypothetical protein
MYSISDVLFRFPQRFPLARYIQLKAESDIEFPILSKDNGISVLQRPSPPNDSQRR